MSSVVIDSSFVPSVSLICVRCEIISCVTAESDIVIPMCVMSSSVVTESSNELSIMNTEIESLIVGVSFISISTSFWSILSVDVTDSARVPSVSLTCIRLEIESETVAESDIFRATNP